MFQNSINNTFTENNFIDNLNLLTIVGKRTESHWSSGGKGNYWSSYDGYDMEADGIGDVPMKIQNVFNFLEGKNPNVRLYLYSPASQALAVSASAFPIIDLSVEIDNHPLISPADMQWATSLQKRFDSNTDIQRNESRIDLSTLIFFFGLSVMGIAIVRTQNH
jgi:nitrous oxidase accessory protein